MTMKFRGHETFFIRKGWLNKGMKYVELTPELFVSKEENPSDILGIGTNMVKSLRYWLQVVGLTVEITGTNRKRVQQFTELGSLVYRYDRFIEEIGTILLLQYKLATNKEDATAWYYFFNKFSMAEFTKDDFVLAVQNYVKLNSDDGKEVAVRSLTDDFMCIINTYVPRIKSEPGKISPENNIDCPLGELVLIDIVNKSKNIYRKTVPTAQSINPWIALAVIVDRADGKTEISLNELRNGENNIGKVFNLDTICMLEVLRKIENLGEIKIIRTAGLDVIKINNQRSFLECVEEYYNTIGA